MLNLKIQNSNKSTESKTQQEIEKNSIRGGKAKVITFNR